MTSKREIRSLRRNNIKLTLENNHLIKKNKELASDNTYFSNFVKLIINLTSEQNNIKLFH